MGPACLTGTDGFLNPPGGFEGWGLYWGSRLSMELDLLSVGVELELGWGTSIVLESSEVKQAVAEDVPPPSSSSASSGIVSSGKPSRSRLEVLDLKLSEGEGEGPQPPRPLNQLSTTFSLPAGSSSALWRDLLD